MADEDREKEVTEAMDRLRKIYDKGPAAQDETLQRWLKFLEKADDMVEIVLKAHLLIEEGLTRIISKFVHHPEFIEDARLTLAHKLNLARSMSLDEANNGMWDLVLLYNRIRNDYGHSLEPDKASDHIRALRDAYIRERGEHRDMSDAKKLSDQQIMKDVAIYALGFLGSFEGEIDRFKDWMATLDRIVNPHRHQRPELPPG